MKFPISLLFLIFFMTGNCFCQVTNPTDTMSTGKAIQYYESILKRNKHSPYALYGLAASYFVERNYRLSLKFSKDNTNEPNDYRAESFILYANSLDRMGRLSEAISVYEEALKLYPDNYQIWYEYALSSYKERKYKKSLPAIKKVIELQPLFTPAHYLYGCLLFESSNDQRCISAFLYALLLDNDSLRSQQAIAFINEYLKHNMSNINIPFLGTRLSLITVDNILYYYIFQKTKNEVFLSLKFEDLCGIIDDYLNSTKDFTPEYQQFYSTLIANKFSGVFSHYVLRMSDNEYIKRWYLLHGDQLSQFAEFLNKNLPGK